jgi:hypothetical protein
MHLSAVERLRLVPKFHPHVLMEWPMHRFRSFMRNRAFTPPDLVGEAYIRAHNAYVPQGYSGNLYRSFAESVPATCSYRSNAWMAKGRYGKYTGL